MNQPSSLSAGLEPTVETIELVCERLADLGLVISPDVARDLVRTILAAEAPRLDARVREALGTSLETIRIAAQSALGMLAATVSAPASPPGPVAPAAATKPEPHPISASAPPAAPATPVASAPSSAAPESRRPIARRGTPKEDLDPFPPAPAPDRDARRDLPEDGARPVFRRPRGR